MVYGTVLLRDFDPLEPRRKALRHVLLNEALFSDAGGIPLHRDRTARHMRHHDRRNHLVVLRQLPLGNSVVREQHLLGVRDHASSLTTSRAALSVRTPINRGCRSLPCSVHSRNATCTTISGRTQWARRRGSPLALV